MKKLSPALFYLVVLSLLSPSVSAGGISKLSGYFIENKGQVHDEHGKISDDVLFYTAGNAMQLFVTKTGYAVVVQENGTAQTTYNKIDFKLDKATIGKGQVIFVKGNNPKLNFYNAAAKLEDITTSQTVIIRNIYPGIDWVWSIDNKGTPKHEFMVNIGADASLIHYTVEGANATLKGENNVVYTHQKFGVNEGPVLYDHKGKVQPGQVSVQGNSISYIVPKEWKTGGFTIDPPLALLYGTVLDTLHTAFKSIVTDPAYNTITVGYSADYAVPVFPQVNGSYAIYPPKMTDAIIMKTDYNQNLIWATFFGGSNNDEANAVTATPTGIFVTGFSESWDFPVATSLGNYNHLVSLTGRDAFIAKFNTQGKWLWSTGYGGEGLDEGMDIKYYNGKVYVAGYTTSKHFPVQQKAGAYFFQDTLLTRSDAFLLEFDTIGFRTWATCFGGSGEDYFTSVFADATGIYTTGYSDSITGASIPLQSFGSAYYQTTFQKTESFVTTFAPGGSLEWSTYFGGSGNDYATCILRNSCGLFICGRTDSAGLPVLSQGNGNYYQPNYAGGGSDGFIAKFDPNTLQQTYCTYYGTPGYDVLTKFASDTSCETIFTGFTTSQIPIVGAGQYYQDTLYGGYDAIMLGLDQNQVPFWATNYGSPENDFGYSVTFSNRFVVDMVGQGFYNYGKLRIGGTYYADGCNGLIQICPQVTSNGESNRFFNLDSIGGGVGIIDTLCPYLLQFQALIPLRNTCPDQCNGAARIDTANIQGCPPYTFLWNNGDFGLSDTLLCQFYWSRVIDHSGQVRTLYGMFDILQVPQIGPVHSNCLNITPDWDTLIHPFGGGPPYIIDFRGVNTDSCPSTAYFDIRDTAGCVVSYSVLWYQNNIHLLPYLKLDATCNLVATLDWAPNSCVDLTNSQYWRYVIISGTDTVNYAFSNSGVTIPRPTHSGFYSGYLDIIDCKVPLLGVFYYVPPTYTVQKVLACHDTVGTITVTVNVDSAALQYYGSYSVYVAISGIGSSYQNSGIITFTNDSATSYTFTNVPSGDYNVNVYYPGMCDSVRQLVDLRTVFFAFNNPILYCGDSTSLIATVSAGFPPFHYHWSSSSIDSSAITISTAGNYSLTVTDSIGCEYFQSILISGSPALRIDSLHENLDPCDPNLFSSAVVYVSGGSPPVTYTWNSGESTNFAQFLPQGTDWIKVHDIYGCSDSLFFTNTKQLPMQVSDSNVNVTCNGYNNGSITLNIQYGYPPFLKLIYFGTIPDTFPGPATVYVNNLGAASDGYVITDSKGCTVQGIAVITEPDSVQYYVTTLNATCSDSDGYAAVGVTGGVSPFSIVWNDNSTSFTRAHLLAGTYSFTISDGNGCQKHDTITIGQNSPMYGTITTTDVTCNGNSDGTANVNIFNGFSPLTYVWSNGAGNVQFVPNLSGGFISVHVTDNKGCTFDTTVYINEPDPLQVFADTGFGIACTGSQAFVNIYAIGGTQPYYGTGGNYYSAGTYTVPVFDNNNCPQSVTFTLTDPAPLIASVTIASQPDCNNAYGSILVSASGGAGNYNLIIDGSTAANFSGVFTYPNVTPGQHSVSVTDGNGCEQDFSINMPFYNQGQGFATPYSPTCAGLNNGYVIITMQGQSPFMVLGNSFTYTYTDTNLVAGTYDYTITDSAGCTYFLEATVTQPDSLLGYYSLVNNFGCGGDSALVSIYSTGGTEPVTGTGTFQFPGGTYQQILTDQNGCTTQVNFTLTNPPALAASVNITEPSCLNNFGAMVVSSSGGTSPYTLQVGPNQYGPYSSSQTVSSLSPGSYILIVTDSAGCQFNIDTNINAYIAPMATAVPANPSCFGYNNGSVTITMQTGIGPFQVNGHTFTSTFIDSNLIAGTFNYTITDSLGCTYSLSATVTDPPQLTGAYNILKGIACNGDEATVTITSSGGIQPVTGTGLFQYAAGAQQVILTDANGCTATVSFTLVAPPVFSATATVTQQPACFTGSGTVIITGFGGVSPYTLNEGANTIPFTDSVTITATPGSYVYQVVDSLGCIVNVSFTITPGDSLTGSVSLINDSCYGTNNGQVMIIMQNGVGPFNANGLSFSDTALFNNLTAGFYSYNVTDSRGCGTNFTATITQPDVLLVDTNLLLSGISCHSNNDAVIKVNASGGTLQYTYTLTENGVIIASQVTNTFSNLSAGQYIVNVTDANGCSESLPVTITPFIPGTDSLNANNLNCNGANNGSLKIYSQPSNRNPYTYSLNGGSPQVYNVFYNLPAGTYQVVVSDKNNCTDTLYVTLTQPDSIDGRVWLNGQLLPVDSVVLNERAYASFTKQNALPWSIVFSPDIARIVNNDTLIQIQPREDISYIVTVYQDSADKNCYVQYKGLIELLPVADMPNIVTPNGDGLNDKWEVDLDKYPHPNVTIFDRWGETVYKSADYANTWDGTFLQTGKHVPDGTYYFIMTVPSQSGIVYRGDINILDSPH